MLDRESHIVSYLERTLKPSRVAHTLNVVTIAVKLAELNGVDPEETRLAALLHDCAKYMAKEELFRYLDACQCQDPLLRQAPFLAHGVVGAEVAREVFGIDNEDILNAIRYHTYGRAGMSLLEKIVYLADYIEDTRDFDGVEHARVLAYQDLEQAVTFTAGHTLNYLVAQKSVIHPGVIDLWNEQLKRSNNDQ